MFKKASVVLTAFVVVLLLVTPQAFGASDNASTDVTWELEGCWISVGIDPDNKDLGDYGNFSSGDLVEDPNSPQEVTVQTSCKGYTVDVEPDSFGLPADHKSEWDSEKPITDFELKGEVTSESVDSKISSFDNFASMSDSKELLSTSNARTTHTDMYYQYSIDDNDVSGEYTVTLIYTASTD